MLIPVGRLQLSQAQARVATQSSLIMAKTLLLLSCSVLSFSRVIVYGPESLRSTVARVHDGKYEIPSSLANFGNPPYGSVIVGRVFEPVNHNDKLGCSPIVPMDFSYGDPDHVVTPIMLIERGNCSFVQKIRHAQDVGASAVIISDNTDFDPTNTVMSDDGTGGNLNIPSFLISKSDSDLIRKALVMEAMRGIVSLTLTFEMKKGGTNVTYEIWMSADQDITRSFLNEFAPYARKLKDITVMTPHYVLWYCSECRSVGYTFNTPDCVSSGRYCAPDPDGPGPLTGKHVVLEDLRQICLYREAKESWWNYIQLMNKTCPTNTFDSDCYKGVFQASGINSEKVEKCMENSFSLPGNYSSDNNLLKNERNELIKAGIFFFPAVIVNSQTMRGDIEPLEVLQAICAGFQATPSTCTDLLEDRNQPKSISETGGIAMSTLLAVVCVAVLLLVAVLVVYRMWLKREMNTELRKQVNQAVGQYFALADVSRSEG